MKKEIKELLKNTLNDLIFNKIDLKVIQFNKESIFKCKEEEEKKLEVLNNLKFEAYEKIEGQRLEKIKEIQNKYNPDIEAIAEKIRLYDLQVKAYNNILNTGLKLILNEIIELITSYCKNMRDFNEFIDLFGYDKIKQDFKLKYNLYYSKYYDYLSISYDIPKKSCYKLFEASRHFKINYIVDEAGHETKNITFSFNKMELQDIAPNYVDYYNPLKKDTSLDPKIIENNIKQLIEVYDEETKKQTVQIIESNKKINEANFYNLDGFIKYNI